jgi:type IV pilus assembly protein PilA
MPRTGLSTSSVMRPGSIPVLAIRRPAPQGRIIVAILDFCPLTSGSAPVWSALIVSTRRPASTGQRRTTMPRFTTLKQDEAGFTLIEMLVTSTIVGALITVAIPMYLDLPKDAANTSALVDVRNAVTAVEAYFADNLVYPATGVLDDDTVTFTGPAVTPAIMKVSTGNTFGYALTADGSGYLLCGQSTVGGATYEFFSKQGGSVVASETVDLDACLAQANP